MGFCSLQHISGWLVHSIRAVPARYVPPSGFGYPHDGLLPIHPWPVFFHTGSTLGINPSKLSPLERPPSALPGGKTHLLFSLLIITLPEQWAGTAGRSSWVLTSQESLATTYVFSIAAAGCSHGFQPFRARSREPRSGFRLISSHALPRSDGKPSERAAPQSINRLPPVLIRIMPKHETGPESPLRFFVPSQSSTFEKNHSPGYVFTLYSAWHYYQLTKYS
jgi:hypothetical protein